MDLSRSAIDLDALSATPLAREPYDHLIVPGFVRADAIAPVLRDFPRVDGDGSYPLQSVTAGASFAALVEALGAPALRDAFATKFGVELGGRPQMITVRGHCGPSDGRIHTDSDTKIITALIYLNPSWGGEGGRLRVLRSGHDLDDYAAEVPPDAGTLLAFRRSERSFHGHRPFVGERRVVQINWVTDASVIRREVRRHRLSAWAKRLNPFRRSRAEARAA